MAELGPLNMLLQNYLSATQGSEAVFIVKRNGTIVTSIIQPEFDEQTIGGLTSLIRYISDIVRIDYETGVFRKNMQQISTPGKGFIYRQINPETVLITICNESANKPVLTAYSIYVANKADKILKGESTSLLVPKTEDDLKKSITPKNEFIFKVIIIGDAGVGKTTTTLMFAHAKFETEYKPTIGVSIVKNEYWIGDDLANFQIWDIAGQEFWKDMRRIYYSGAQGCLILYDVTRPISFKNIKVWYNELNTYIPAQIPAVLCANKIDLETERKVMRDEGEKMSAELGIPYKEISAKTSENIDEVFCQLGEILIQRSRGESN
ncbi:MAG: GTP-binding protein [Candidatus Helarchaeota archaeon]